MGCGRAVFCAGMALLYLLGGTDSAATRVRQTEQHAGGNITVGLVWGCRRQFCLTLMNVCVNTWNRKRKLHKFLKLLDI